jgi:IS30 family transposase
MARRLAMAEIDTILTPHKAGHSNREIAALLGVNRETIGKRLARAKAKNQRNAPAGKAAEGPNGFQPNAPPERNGIRIFSYRRAMLSAAIRHKKAS